MHKFLHRLADASKAFKAVLLNDDSTSIETNDQSLVKNFGCFVDGTPLTAQSLNDWKSLPIIEKINRNSEHLQKSVLQWKRLVKRPLSTSSNKRYYMFLHIPKAGGTTLKHIISKNYYPRHVIHAHAPELRKNPSIISIPGEAGSRRVVMGHHHRSGLVYQLLNDRPIVHFTMLRDPIKRVISYFNFIKTGKSHHPKQEQIKNWTLDDYVRSDFKEVQNGQTLRILGAHSADSIQSVWDDSELLLAEAKRVLEHEFSLFGLTERYSEFLIMANKVLGWQEIVYARKINTARTAKQSSQAKVKSTSKSDDINEGTLAVLKSRNQIDIALYEFASDLFEQRCQQLGITTEGVESYNRLNERYRGILTEVGEL